MGYQLNPAATRKARKPHNCFWCQTDIGNGEVHTYWVWEEDGRLTTVRMHNECFRAEERENNYDEYICQENHDRGLTHDETWEKHEGGPQ